MEYIARKISRAKWDVKPFMAKDDISADAITTCLRTSNNGLSVWLCNADDTDRKEIVLALAAAMDKIETIDIVLLQKTLIEKKGFVIKLTPGNTPVRDIADRHADLIDLTMKRICDVAVQIANAVRNDSIWQRYTTREIRQIICNAVKHGRVNMSDLKQAVAAEIQNCS